jgi:hypothetical protein
MECETLIRILNAREGAPPASRKRAPIAWKINFLNVPSTLILGPLQYRTPARTGLHLTFRILKNFFETDSGVSTTDTMALRREAISSVELSPSEKRGVSL